jgi:hypothetical protein
MMMMTTTMMMMMMMMIIIIIIITTITNSGIRCYTNHVLTASEEQYSSSDSKILYNGIDIDTSYTGARSRKLGKVLTVNVRHNFPRK